MNMDDMELLDVDFSMTKEEQELLEAVEADGEYGENVFEDSLDPNLAFDAHSRPGEDDDLDMLDDTHAKDESIEQPLQNLAVDIAPPASSIDDNKTAAFRSQHESLTNFPKSGKSLKMPNSSSSSSSSSFSSITIKPEEIESLRKLEPVMGFNLQIDAARITRNVGEANDESTWEPSDSVHAILESADVSTKDSPSSSVALAEAEKRFTDIITTSSDPSIKEYADGVLQWRTRGAGLLEVAATRGFVPAPAVASLVYDFVQNEEMKSVPLCFVPEIEELLKNVKAYQAWVREYQNILPYFRTSRAGRRGTRSHDIPNSKRMSWERFCVMRERVKNEFPLLDSEHLRNLRSLSSLATSLADAISDVVERSGGAYPARPSSRVLEQHYQEVDEKCIAIDDIPILVRGATDLIRLCKMRKWRQLARRSLLHHNSRGAVSSLDDGADEEMVRAKLVWADPGDLAIEDLQELHDLGLACGAFQRAPTVPFSGKHHLVSECKEEQVLTERLSDLRAKTDIAQKKYTDTFQKIAEIYKLPERTTDKNSAGHVDRYKGPSDESDENAMDMVQELFRIEESSSGMCSEAGTGPKQGRHSSHVQHLVWFPERNQAHVLLACLQWYKISKPLLGEIRPILEACITENTEGAPSREIGESLEKLETVLRNGEEVGLGSANQAKALAHVGADQDRDAIGAARSCIEFLVEEYHLAKVLWNRVDTKLAYEVERWRRSLKGHILEVEWEENDWYLAKVAEYRNLDKLHFLVYDTGEVEAILVKWDGEALSMDGQDRIVWREAPPDREFIVSAEQEKEFKKRIRSMVRELDRAHAKARRKNPKLTDAQDGDQDSLRMDTAGRNLKNGSNEQDHMLERNVDKSQEDKSHDDDDDVMQNASSFEDLIVGDFIKVEWKDEFWLGVVRKFDKEHGLHCVLYEDGNSEYMRLHEDGTAQSKDGAESFSWINTSESFHVKKNEPIPEFQESGSDDEDEDGAEVGEQQSNAEDNIDDENASKATPVSRAEGNEQDNEDGESSPSASATKGSHEEAGASEHEENEEEADDKLDGEEQLLGRGKRRRSSVVLSTSSIKRRLRSGSSGKTQQIENITNKTENKKEKKRKSKDKEKKKRNSKDKEKKSLKKSSGRQIIRKVPLSSVETMKRLPSQGGNAVDPADWLAHIPRAGDPASKDSVLEKKRKLGRKVIRKIIQGGITGPQLAGTSVLVSMLSRDVEKAIFVKCNFYYWDEPSTRWRRRENANIDYGQMVRTICTNLKQNESLLRSLVNRDLTPTKLVHMKTSELAVEAVRRKFEREVQQVRQSKVVIPTNVVVSSNFDKETRASEKQIQDEVASSEDQSLAKAPAQTNSLSSSPILPVANGDEAKQDHIKPATKSSHPIDLKIAEAYKAETQARLLSQENRFTKLKRASSVSNAEALPSLREVLREATEKSTYNDDEEDNGGVANISESAATSEKLQRKTWQGRYRHEKTIFTLRPDSAIYGPGISLRKRILPSVMLGTLGRQGQNLRLHGNMKPEKVLTYLRTVETHPQSSRQFVVAEMQAGSSNGTSLWKELVKLDRVGIVEFSSGVQAYLIPPRMVSQFPQVRPYIRDTNMGAAVIVVKPASMPNLTALLSCSPLEIESDPKTYVGLKQGDKPQSGPFSTGGTDPKKPLMNTRDLADLVKRAKRQMKEPSLHTNSNFDLEKAEHSNTPVLVGGAQPPGLPLIPPQMAQSSPGALPPTLSRSPVALVPPIIPSPPPSALPPSIPQPPLGVMPPSGPPSLPSAAGLQGLLSSLRKSSQVQKLSSEQSSHSPSGHPNSRVAGSLESDTYKYSRQGSREMDSNTTGTAHSEQQHHGYSRSGPSDAERDFIAQTASYCTQNQAHDGPSAYHLLSHRLHEYPFARHDHSDHGVFLHYLKYYGENSPTNAVPPSNPRQYSQRSGYNQHQQHQRQGQYRGQHYNHAQQFQPHQGNGRYQQPNHHPRQQQFPNHQPRHRY